MTNPQKAKGAQMERVARDFLAEAVSCERIPAGATIDRGDLWTERFCLQVKNCRSLSLGAWMDQTKQQQLNAGKPCSAVIFKRKGTTDPGRQFVLMDLEQFREILAAMTPASENE